MAIQEGNTPKPAWEDVLTLLSHIVIKNGHSLSWYTSKKGRVWLTLKGFDPTTYTTSVEHSTDGNNHSALESFLVCMYKHWPKHMLTDPPLNTWLTLRAVADELPAAKVWIEKLMTEVDLDTGEIRQEQPATANDAIPPITLADRRRGKQTPTD